jgi:multiple sugar transport system permease protein
MTIRKKWRVGRILAWVLLSLFLAVTILPIYWTLRTALSTNAAIIRHPENVLPVDVNTFNFERVLTKADPVKVRAAGGNVTAKLNIAKSIRNSIIVATCVTIGQVTSCSLAAYAFARLKFKGQNLLFSLFLTALMVPPIFTLIPNFLLVRDMRVNLGLFKVSLRWLPWVSESGWINHLPGVIAPFFLMTPFAVFFLRQFFLGISQEVVEASVLDGAGHFRRFFQIILPMASAPIATLAIITYVTSWNEFLWPFVAGKAESIRVINVALNDFKTQTPGSSSPDWTGLMAATFVSAVPIIVLFAVLGRRVIDSIRFSGIK